MKKTFFILSLFLCTSANAQNLSLNNLLSLQKSSLEIVEEFLISNNWKFIKARTLEEEKFNTASFQFYDPKGKGQYAHLTYIFNENWIEIQLLFFQKAKYFEYLNAVKALNTKLVYTSATEDSGIVKIYEGKSKAFIFETNKMNYEDSSLPQWKLIIQDKLEKNVDE